ncbi:MAG: YkgJ family cysteine cluster protein [Candidatus Alcyoniella australis]|nr:YkgJ family cysteine cluster protein [Candidatus Alcyoniella australis]
MVHTQHENILKELRSLHDKVDHQSEKISGLLGTRLVCRSGCCECCQDELTVFEIEALRIMHEYPRVLATQQPAPEGRCAFQGDDGRCRIYSARPYVCRTQGLPLRWLEFGEQGCLELRDICPLNDNGPLIENIDSECCFTIGPTEERLRELQSQLADGALKRVKLRDLFNRRLSFV